MSFRFHRGARKDLVDALEYYITLAEGLGDRVLQDVKKAIRTVLENPERFARVERRRSRRRIHRYEVPKLPYSIIYELVGDEVVIMAVAHHSRNPNYWCRRRP